jgi:hypothetical protein
VSARGFLDSPPVGSNVVDAADRATAGAPITGYRSAEGDPARLRRIPMIGGAEGAVPGTSPHRQRRLGYWQPGRRNVDVLY